MPVASPGISRVSTGGGGWDNSYAIPPVDPNYCGIATSDTISIGETRGGLLRTSDCVYAGVYGAWYTPAHGYALILDEAASVRITTTGAINGPYIIVTDAFLDREFVTIGGDYESTESIVMMALDAGKYIVWVTGHLDIHSAAYELTVEEGPPPCDAESAVRSIAPGRSRAGALGAGDDCLFPLQEYGQFAGGTVAHGYTIELDEPSSVQIDLTSDDFDAVLVITDPRMQIRAIDDNDGSGFNSRFNGHLAAGTYIIWGTSLARSATGEYVLSVPTPAGGTAGAH